MTMLPPPELSLDFSAGLVGRRSGDHRQRGAAAVLAMMFLVIFSSLAAAMAIVSEGNLIVADSNLRVSRSQSAAESGMTYMIYQINKASRDVYQYKKEHDSPTSYFRKGVVNTDLAESFWTDLSAKLVTNLSGLDQNKNKNPSLVKGVLTYGPIAVAADATTFTATIEPHPIKDENYDSSYYQRAPYNDTTQFDYAVSSTHPLDARWIRVLIVAKDNSKTNPIIRSVQMDFKIEKKIRYAILAKSRLMIGRNVMISGPIGSRFEDTNLKDGHPIQMESDFLGLDPDTSPNGLDAQLKIFRNTLATNDLNGDNRLRVNSAETEGIDNPTQYDTNGDGYIDEYDFFLKKYANKDGNVTPISLDIANSINRAQLFNLIDTFGDPGRPGYNDGVIDAKDQYAKIHGKVLITASKQSWQDGAANGQYQDYFQGPIKPGYQQNALTFDAQENKVAQFEPSDFDVSSFKTKADGDMAAQAITQANNTSGSGDDQPQITQLATPEAVPYGSAHPYDYYNRPVYKNMTFTNITIPKGTNALFENCKFIGVTFVETEINNEDENYNYNGKMDQSGNYVHRDKGVTINNPDGSTVEISGDTTKAGTKSTKDFSNNIRFDNCHFEGAVVSSAPKEYTQVRNKLNFTGKTQFADMTKPADTPDLTDEQRALFRRSTLLAPHMSVEMGTFVDPDDANQKVTLSGTIVAGVIDMRGNVDINGTLLTTFKPVNGEGPVIGNTSPYFNTTLGYFNSSEGDLEAERPDQGVGEISLRYDPSLALPDGILSPIGLTPMRATYFEGGAK